MSGGELVRLPFTGAGGGGKGGSGSGGGAQGNLQNNPDNLRSTDSMEAILGLCQGPIEGLQNGDKSFFFDTTPFQNADGSYNFTLFTLNVDPGGYPAGTIYPILGGKENFRYVDQPLFQNNPVSVTVSPHLPEMILRLQVLKLFTAGTDATLATLPATAGTQSDFIPNTAQLQITYQQPGGPVINPFNPGPYGVIGRTSTLEYHEIRIPLLDSSNNPLVGPVTLTVNNLTPDTDASPCKIVLEGLYEVTGGMFGTYRADAVGMPLAIMGTTQPAVTRTTQQAPYRGQDANGNNLYGIDYLSIRLDYGLLYTQTHQGGVASATSQILVYYKPTNGTTGQIIYPQGPGGIALGGLTTAGGYIQEITFPVFYEKDANGNNIPDTFDVTVQQIAPDNAAVFMTITWESMEEIIGGPVQYNGVATTHIWGQASTQTAAMPQMWGIYNLKQCKVPSNYNPVTRTYTGTWDGTFQTTAAWTNNPAWVLYDLATNQVSGAGAYWPFFSLDPYDVYAAGQWCDELVPDGAGGSQPRFTFNGLLTNQRPIKEQLAYMAGVFNGVLVDDVNGNVRLVWDAPVDPVMLFTNENVVAGANGPFQYTYTDYASRYNWITVSFHNPNIYYQQDTREFSDQLSITKFGRVSLDYTAHGCTDPHEALRRAAYQYYTSTTEVEIVSFRTNRLGMLLMPFSLILVADPDMQAGISGRIEAIDPTFTIITLRDAVYLEPGANYELQVTVPNPAYTQTGGSTPPTTNPNPTEIVSASFGVATNGATTQIILDSPLPTSTDPRAAFLITAVDSTGAAIGMPQVYRVTRIDEVDGHPDMIDIQAIEVNRAKWTLIDNISDSAVLDYTYLGSSFSPPSAVVLNTNLVSLNGGNIIETTLSWNASPDFRVKNYEVSYRRSGDPAWASAGQTNKLSISIFNIPAATYDFRVRGLAYGTGQTAWVTLLAQGVGLSLAPVDVTGMSALVVGDHVNLSWAPIPSSQLAYYWVRFTPATTGATWETSLDVALKVYTTSIQLGAASGTYYVKAVSPTGTSSVNAAFAVVALNSSMLQVDGVAQAPAWTAGTATDMMVDAALNNALVVSMTTASLHTTSPADTLGGYGWNVPPLNGTTNYASMFSSPWPDRLWPAQPFFTAGFNINPGAFSLNNLSGGGAGNSVVINGSGAPAPNRLGVWVATHTYAPTSGDTNIGTTYFQATGGVWYQGAIQVYIPSTLTLSMLVADGEVDYFGTPWRVVADLTVRDQWQTIQFIGMATASGTVGMVLRLVGAASGAVLYSCDWEIVPLNMPLGPDSNSVVSPTATLSPFSGFAASYPSPTSSTTNTLAVSPTGAPAPPVTTPYMTVAGHTRNETNNANFTVAEITITDLIPGQTYELSAQIYLPVGSPATYIVLTPSEVTAPPPGTAPFSVISESQINPAVFGSWQTASYSFVANVPSLALMLRVDDGSDGTSTASFTIYSCNWTLGPWEEINLGTVTGTVPSELQSLLPLDYGSGSYTWLSANLGSVFKCRLVPNIIFSANNIGNEMVSWITLSAVSALNAFKAADMAYTLTVEAYDGTSWGAPTPLSLGDFYGQQFRYTATLQSNNPVVMPTILTAEVDIYLPARTAYGSNAQSLTTGPLALTFTPPFSGVPTLTVTPKNSATGDYYNITAETVSGFSIEFFNSAGTAVARTFDWHAYGFGGN